MGKSRRSLRLKKSQKKRNMKGCSHKKSRRSLGGKRRNSKCKSCKQRGGGCGCSTLGQLGGCGSCLQSGGSAYNSALIGSPWKGDVSNWPGVGGLPGQTNFFELNKYPVDPQTQGVVSERDGSLLDFKGGKRRKKIGGQLIPTDLTNIGRSLVYGVGSAYNGIRGYTAPVNPLPYKDQITATTQSKALGY